MTEVAAESFAELLKQYRARAGLTQEVLAERTGLSVRGISDLERGIKRRPYPHTIYQLIQALGLTEDEADRFQQAGRNPAGSAERLESSESVDAGQRRRLPVQPTSFVGRQREINEMTALLAREAVRLLTLTGPAGVGKTRLAVRVAERVAPRFSDGVVFVPLAALTDPDLIPGAIARALGVWEGSGRPIMESLLHHLRLKQMLLVLDNFEHLLPAAEVVSQILAACPTLSILVTSRAVLHIAAEWTYPIAPLPLPAPGHVGNPEALGRYDIVQLFLQRALAIQPGFALTGENGPTIAEICSRLDGLPLAIELAAARTRLFSPQGLLERLSDRLELLAGGPRDVPVRQQTLRNTIDWSYRLLSPEEQRLFARLSVFAGGCTFETAKSVCDPEGELDLIAGMSSLVDKSLVQRSGEEQRFTILETLREYAAEKLDECGEARLVRDRHLVVFLCLGEDADRQIHGPAEATWYQRLEAEQNNLRAAMDWAEESGKVEAAVQLAGALGWFWYARGHWSEGQQRLVRLLAAPVAGECTVARARALFAAGHLTASLGDLNLADTYVRRAIALGERLGRDGARVQSLACAFRAFSQADLDGLELSTLAAEGLRLAQECGDRWVAAMAHLAAGVVSHRGGNLDAARCYQEKGLAIVRELGESFNAAPQLFWLADVCKAQGELHTARARMEEAITTLRSLDAKPMLADVLIELGGILLDQGEIERGIALEEEALAQARECGATPEICIAMRYLAHADALRGDHAGAAARYDEALGLARSIGELAYVAPILGLRASDSVRQGDLERARSQCEEGLDLARAAGSELISPVLLQALGWIAREEGRCEEAAQRFHDALTVARREGDAMCQLSLIQDLAIVAARSGSAERAARLLGAEAVLRAKMGLTLEGARRTELEQAEEEARAALGESAWNRAIEVGHALNLRDAAAYTLDEEER